MLPTPQKLKNKDASRRRLRLQVVTKCVVVCFVFLSAGPLFASCGNYLYRNGKPVSWHAVSIASQESRLLAGGSIGFAPPHESVPPCSGPNCSSRPMPHFPVSQVPLGLVKGLRAECILESMAEHQPASETLEHPQSERGAFFEPLPIFRPPAA